MGITIYIGQVSNLSDYVKTEDLDVTLNDYAKTSDIEGTYITKNEVSQDYVKTETLNTEYAKKVELKEVSNSIPTVPTKISELENDSNFLTNQDITDYAKTNDIHTWVEDKNYLTKHQSLDGYATTEDIPSLDGYATEDWVSKQKFVIDDTESDTHTITNKLTDYVTTGTAFDTEANKWAKSSLTGENGSESELTQGLNNYVQKKNLTTLNDVKTNILGSATATISDVIANDTTVTGKADASILTQYVDWTTANGSNGFATKTNVMPTVSKVTTLVGYIKGDGSTFENVRSRVVGNADVYGNDEPLAPGDNTTN